jgi:hypothetical protein
VAVIFYRGGKLCTPQKALNFRLIGVIVTLRHADRQPL